MLGIGAILGSAILPKIKAKLSLDALVAAATVLFGGITLVLAYARDVYVVGAALVAGGAAWIALMARL